MRQSQGDIFCSCSYELRKDMLLLDVTERLKSSEPALWPYTPNTPRAYCMHGWSAGSNPAECDLLDDILLVQYTDEELRVSSRIPLLLGSSQCCLHALCLSCRFVMRKGLQKVRDIEWHSQKPYKLQVACRPSRTVRPLPPLEWSLDCIGSALEGVAHIM